MTIGQLSQRTSVPIKILRTYEGFGFLCTRGRSEGNYRLFGEETLWCVQVIQGLRSLGLTLKEIQAFLHSSDVRVDQEGHIIGLGLSFQPTQHQFHLDEKTLYTWCALDTLAFPALLGRTARVISSCPATGQEIHLTVTPQGIADLSPAGAVVSVRLPGEDTDICHVQEDICNDGYFFVSREVASTWPSLHPKAVLLSLEEAAELGQVLASAIRSIAGGPAQHEQHSI
jgi:alkylmercury lyase